MIKDWCFNGVVGGNDSRWTKYSELGEALVLNLYDKHSMCPRKNFWLCLKKYNSFFPQLEMCERVSVATVVLSLLLVIKVIGFWTWYVYWKN